MSRCEHAGRLHAQGKPLNVWNLKRDIVYKNDEMYYLMRALDIEDNIECLRYDKVILATDADVDGLHIRNLLITYFLKFFGRPRLAGLHVVVLEQGLFGRAPAATLPP